MAVKKHVGLANVLSFRTMSPRLIKEFGVAAIPGSAFDANDGCYLRVVYGALKRGTVAEALKRLECRTALRLNWR